MQRNHLSQSRKSRAVGLFAGVAVQVLFGVTVAGLYAFMAGWRPTNSQPSLALDAALALLFAVPHSYLRLPSVQARICARIGREFFGLFYCAITCATLWAMFLFWQADAAVLWRAPAAAAIVIQVLFHACWIALAYSLHLTGLGYQTGYTEWSYWRRREPLPRRRFVPRGAYQWLRHPVYLSFLGLVWFNPRQTSDQLVLEAVWTIYIAVGSYLKDERLAHYMGEEYRTYQSLVPGYPGLRLGPLGIRAVGPHDTRS
jgi:protein-S-isoprenylcysteine O-methyltransferase Ste14